MTQANIRPLDGRTRASWIRLRTMILLRWFAIAGQLTAAGFWLVIDYFTGMTDNKIYWVNEIFFLGKIIKIT